MAALKTYSKFYYGHTVTSDNQYFNIKEGAGPELTVKVPVGSYTLTKFKVVIMQALNDIGALDYVVNVDRFTRKITITASGNFQILGLTGVKNLQSLLPLMGFNKIDYAAATEFEGQSASGYVYEPQFILQSYVAPSDNLALFNAVKSKSASGNKVSVQKFGEERLAKMNIKFITDIAQDPDVMKSNPNGVADANAFMSYAITQAPFEFIPDEDKPSTFHRVILDKTPESSDGLAYELKETYDQNLPFYFETGKIELKVITE